MKNVAVSRSLLMTNNYGARVTTNHIIESVQQTNLGTIRLRTAETSPRSNGLWGTLLAQLDSRGIIIGQMFRQEMQDALLAKDKERPVLFEHYVHQDQNIVNPPKWIPDTDFGLRVTTLDGSLASHTQIFMPDEWSPTTEDVYRTPEGGWLLVGCKNQGGDTFLQYMNAAGVFSARQLLHSNNAHPCDRSKMGAGEKPGEAVLISNSWESGTVITRIHYSE